MLKPEISDFTSVFVSTYRALSSRHQPLPSTRAKQLSVS